MLTRPPEGETWASIEFEATQEAQAQDAGNG